MAGIIIPGEQHYIPDPEFSELRFRFSTGNADGSMSVECTTDSGETWRAIAIEPPSNAGAGWVQYIGTDGKLKWGPITNTIKSSSSVLSALQVWTDFSFPAALQDGLTFGVFEVPDGLSFEAYGVQLNVFQPSDPNVSIGVSFIHGSTGATLSEIATLSGGSSFVSTVFNSPFVLESKQNIKALIVIGGDTNLDCGSYLTARLLLRGL